VRNKEVLAKVKASLAKLEEIAPGRAIEVRIPPYAAIQCGDGPTHTRGTPPNVIEMDADTWLSLASGDISWLEAVKSGKVSASGARADLSAYLPLTLASYESVGPKLDLARRLHKLDTIGEDVVARVVDSLVATGKTPATVTACIHAEESTSREQLRKGLVRGCARAGVELAERPAESCEVEEKEISLHAKASADSAQRFELSPDLIQVGDKLIALPSSGFHSHGFTEINSIIDQRNLSLDFVVTQYQRASADVFMTPSEIYTLDCIALMKLLGENLRNFAYVGDGGIASNVARALPHGIHARLQRATWSLPVEMEFMAEMAGWSSAEMEQVWNCGIGMIAIVAPDQSELTLRALAARGMKAWVAGEIVAGKGPASASLEGSFASR